MNYVALLRGVNVGGNNKVNMAQLRLALEQAGFSNVRTYINSGNVLFSTNESNRNSILQLIDNTVIEKFGVHIDVIIKSQNELCQIASSIPIDWQNNVANKCDVLFLWDSINDESIIATIKPKTGIESVIYVDGALVWSIARENVGRSNLLKIVGSDIYKQMTVRNCNTVRKIKALFDDMLIS